MTVNRDEMEARQCLLEDLYRRDGRDRPNHPFHATYTGLWRHWTAGSQPNAQLNTDEP